MQVGDIVDGRYRLLDVLGEGAAGKVFRCEDLGQGNRLLALKLLHAKDPRWESFFRSEFSILSRLAHPNLVRVYDFGPAPDDTSWYFTQDLVVGKPLLDACAGKKVDEVLALFVEICRALEFIHGHGVLHRDLKPANILVQQHADPGERVRVLDFGLWRELDPTPQRGARWAGTPPYLASEVLRGFGHSVCADLYAVGVTLYQILTRKLPHGRGTPQELLQARKVPATNLLDIGYRSRPLADLLARLLDEDPLRRPQSAAEVASVLSQVIPNQSGAMPVVLGRARLVGREQERQLVLDIVESVKARRPGAARLVIVEGVDGIGKSRFISEIKAEVQLTGGRAGVGTCIEDARSHYHPIADLVRALAPLAHGAELSDSERVVIDRLCPELSGAPRPERLQMARADRDRFHAHAASLFGRLAGANNIAVLIVEDVPWIDEASASLLATILRSQAEGLLVIVTASVTQGPIPDEIVNAAGNAAVRLQLEPLDKEDLRKFVAALLGIYEVAQIPDPLVDRLHLHTRGNPLDIEEVIALMIDRGDLKRDEHGWSLDEFRGPAAAMPSSSALEVRLSRLGDVEKDTLRALAVFGRPTGPKQLAAIAGMDLAAARQSLATAEAQGLIRVVDTEDGRPHVAFRHPHIRDVLLKGLRDAGELGRWHATCAAVLEEKAQENVAPVAETLGHHLERAGELSRAAEYYLVAADHGIAQFAFEDALALGRLAARLVVQTQTADRGGDGAEAAAAANLLLRCDVVVGKALFLAGQTREARAFLESAVQSSEGARNKGDFAELHVWLARACRQLGAAVEGTREIERALQNVGASEPLASARLLIARGELLVLVHPRGAFTDASRALRLLETARGKTVEDELAALAVKATGALGLGLREEAVASARARVALAGHEQRRIEEIPARRLLAQALSAAGDRLGAREHLNAALKLARENHHGVEEALLQRALGDQLYISGGYAEAIARYQNAATLAAERGLVLERADALRSIGRCYLAKGDYDRAIEHLRAVVDTLDRSGDSTLAVPSRCDLVQALIAKGAMDEAGSELPVARARLSPDALPAVRGMLELTEGAYAMAHSDFAQARRGLLTAIARFREAQDTFSVGEALILYGQLMLRSGSPSRALRIARRTESIFNELDARGQLKRLKPLLNAALGLSQKNRGG